MTDHVTEVLKLGFGKCALQVQVPEQSQYKSVEDLSGKRVATSFEVVAGEYFKDVDRRVEERDGVGKFSAPTKIEYVGGSVEAACALGLSDGIGASQRFLPFTLINVPPLGVITVDLVGTHVALVKSF